MATSYNNIGLVYQYKGDIDQALQYYNYNKSITINESISPNSLAVATSYNNIGRVYQGKGYPLHHMHIILINLMNQYNMLT